MFDLMLTGGRVIDPSQGIDGPCDIGVAQGKIAQIAPEIPREEARRVLDVSGKLVAPGLIDIHCHCYEGLASFGIPPDVLGVWSGVTTVVDAGTSGGATFGAFPRFVVPLARSNVYCFINIFRFAGVIRLEETIRLIGEHQELIRGIKIQPTGRVARTMGIDSVRQAKKAAAETGTRIMVHIGESHATEEAALTRQILPLLDAGDILSHAFTGMPGSVLTPDGGFMPEFKEAAQRGVILDTANGHSSFSFRVAQKALEAGILPSTLSTDLSLDERAQTPSLTEVMSQWLALGLDLGQVVRMVTANSAQALGLSHQLGSLAQGRQADISVLEVVSADWQFRDSPGELLRGSQAIVPALVIKSGEVLPVGWGPRPWGWRTQSAFGQ